MAGWTKQQLKLRQHHGWRAKPGYKIFVADRGAVRFDVPADWMMLPGEAGSIEFHDRQPPDDDCRLQMSLLRLDPRIDWSGVPLAQVFWEAIKDDPRDMTWWGEMVHFKRDDLEVAWIEARFIDPNEQRDAIARFCIARRANVIPFITMDLWVDDLNRFGPVWDEMLRTLQLGQYVTDPTRGPVSDA